MADEKKPLALPVEVAKKYDLNGINAGKYDFGGNYGVIDLSKISVARADNLVAQKFPFLVEKAVPAAGAPKPKDEIKNNQTA